jgi:hypothetical protein
MLVNVEVGSKMASTSCLTSTTFKAANSIVFRHKQNYDESTCVDATSTLIQFTSA